MNALDSPLEALAFKYLSYGDLTVVINIWTFIAFMTAAITFWMIRASLCPKADPLAASPAKVASQPSPPDAMAAEPTLTSAESLTTPAPSVSAVEITDGATRGKFTAYYNVDDVVRDGGNGEYHNGDGNDGECWSDRWNWESVLRVRMELYRYQDLTVLDGNVVRLWDDGKRRNCIS